MKTYCVYILTNQARGTLYVGVTSDLLRRLEEHKTEPIKSFTKKYHLHRLVHVEQFEDIESAIAREKQLKNWKREWKIELIQSNNKNWENLSLRYGMDAGSSPA